MKKMLILGCPGAGKTDFSFKIAKTLKLPLIHLDQYYWNSQWKEPQKEQWEQKVKTLLKKEKWIMDGNYGGTLDLRIEAADTIIFLDFPSWLCLYRVLKRTIKYYGKSRSDMAIGCDEKFSLNFYHYVLMFNYTRRKNILKKLSRVNGMKQVYVLKGRTGVNDFLKTIQ